MHEDIDQYGELDFGRRFHKISADFICCNVELMYKMLMVYIKSREPQDPYSFDQSTAKVHNHANFIPRKIFITNFF